MAADARLTNEELGSQMKMIPKPRLRGDPPLSPLRGGFGHEMILSSDHERFIGLSKFSYIDSRLIWCSFPA